MHDGEIWQEYAKNGEYLKTGGYDSRLENPDTDYANIVGAVCVWIYRRDRGGEVLFQQRSAQITNGLKWDVSAAGHMNYGETPVQAAQREAAEEVGAALAADQLQYIFTVRGAIDGKNLLNHYFIYDYTGQPDDFHFDDHEVAAVQWVPVGEFREFIAQHAKVPLQRAEIANQISEAWLEKAMHGDL